MRNYCSAAATEGGIYDPKDDPRRLRPGETDPNPETKPARPDHEDLEEDEKEMLQEARARLANTKGKKAKRKAREKQLEEARRLAALQKRRELKAAGITVHMKKKKKKGIDYNKEIPFNKKPPPGFFSIQDERDREIMDKKNDFNPILLQQMEGTRRDEMEEQSKKKDINTLKEKMKKNLPQVVNQMNKSKIPESIRKRAKIILPDPQISDQDISEISKLGHENEEDNGIHATKMLISNYTPSLQTPMQGQNFITDRTPSRPDNIMVQAQNLKNLTTQSTPLIPSENLPITDFEGPIPGETNIKTPNPLLLRLRTPMENSESMTPGGVLGTPRRTPFRDQFNINTENDIQTRIKMKEEREKLKEGLTSLPEPKREIQIAMPNLPDDLDDMDIDKGTSSNTEDQSERDRKINMLKQAKKGSSNAIKVTSTS